MGVLHFQNNVMKIINFLFSLSGLICNISTYSEYTNCKNPVEYIVWIESLYTQDRIEGPSHRTSVI